jgi:hypothetical protein
MICLGAQVESGREHFHSQAFQERSCFAHSVLGSVHQRVQSNNSARTVFTSARPHWNWSGRRTHLRLLSVKKKKKNNKICFLFLRTTKHRYITANKLELINPVSVYFSTNSIGLFQFTTDLVCSRVINNFTVSAHLTQANELRHCFCFAFVFFCKLFVSRYTVDEDERKKGTHDTHASTRDMKLGRLSFMEVLSAAPSNSQVLKQSNTNEICFESKQKKVFFCGAPALQWMVQIAARTFNLEYYPGHRFASDGAISCQRVSAFRCTCSCNRFPLCLVSTKEITMFCFVFCEMF